MSILGKLNRVGEQPQFHPGPLQIHLPGKEFSLESPRLLAMHRFRPTLFKIEGFTVTEVPVTNNPRFAGQSHYGVWNRLFASFYDLLAVRWMKKRMFRYQIAERVN